MQKADLHPPYGANPDHVAVDETVIQLDDEQYWLYAAVDCTTNRLLHVLLFATRNTAVPPMFMAELREKHRVDDALILVGDAPWLKTPGHQHSRRFCHQTHGNRNSGERIFREVKHGTNRFGNCFSHAEAETVETWPQAFAFAWNRPI